MPDQQTMGQDAVSEIDDDLKAITSEDKNVIGRELRGLNMRDLVATHRRLHQMAAQGNLLTGFSRADMNWFHTQVEDDLVRRAKDDERDPPEASPLEWAATTKHFPSRIGVIAARFRQAEKKRKRKSTDVGGYAVKVLREEDGGVVVGGIMCINGDPARKDLQGEYFTPETDTMHQVYKSVPALFHHGLDPTIGLEVIGHRVKAEKVDEGLWVEDWLDRSSTYWEMVEPLLNANVLHYSPGSAPHLVRKAKDGRLLSYPVIEDTLTVTPAQHRTRPVVQIKAAYEAAGLELPPELTGENGRGDAAASRQIERARARAAATITRIESLL